MWHYLDFGHSVTDSLFICRFSQTRRKENSMTLTEKMDSKKVTMAHTTISSPGWFHELVWFDTEQQERTILHTAERLI